MPDAADNCALAKLDEAEIAWAAGFFDGEGSTMARGESRRPEYHQLQVAVPQHGNGSIPEVLVRFQAAAFGMGRIGPHSRAGMYSWRSCGFEEAQALIALLWRYLGPIKRAQAIAAASVVRAQYEHGRYAPRRTRRPAHPHREHVVATASRDPSVDLEAAWAAGFLDAEGCFGIVRSQSRKRGPAWYRIRASASQHDDKGIPAEVLQRLQRALGVGRIEPHGENDDFKWVAEGLDKVERVLTVARRWLGSVKWEQSRKALEAFRAQVRFRGDDVHCARGHIYDHLATRGGRRRRVCNACSRLCARRRRAAQGIKPRQFRDLARRYNY